jgi:mRNA interferase RelE/StbE
MSYHIAIANSAKRDMRRLDSSLQQRVAIRLQVLRNNPRPSGVKKSRDRENEWRIRVGDYRIIYEIDDDERLIVILRIKHRREAYR